MTWHAGPHCTEAMSKGGHTLLATAIGGALALAGRDLALLGVVIAFAGRLPDSLEIVTGVRSERRAAVNLPVSHALAQPHPYLPLILVGLWLPRFGPLPAGRPRHCGRGPRRGRSSRRRPAFAPDPSFS